MLHPSPLQLSRAPRTGKLFTGLVFCRLLFFSDEQGFIFTSTSMSTSNKDYLYSLFSADIVLSQSPYPFAGFEECLKIMIRLLCWNVVACFAGRSYMPPQRNKTLITSISWDIGTRRSDILPIYTEVASWSKQSWPTISALLLRI